MEIGVFFCAHNHEAPTSPDLKVTSLVRFRAVIQSTMVASEAVGGRITAEAVAVDMTSTLFLIVVSSLSV